jgi:hypothetical protein
MPRRPTRSRRSQRTTRKDLSRRLQDLTEEEYGDLPTLTLADAIAYDVETVDEERGIVRVDGELRRRETVDVDLGDLWRADLESAADSGGDD